MATEPLIERIRRAPSPHLRRRFAAAGIAPERFGPEDAARLPLVRRRDIDLDRLEDPVGELRLGDAPPPVRLGTAGGAGAIAVLTWTARDLARVAASGARMLRVAGVARGSRVANTLEGGFATPGSLVLGDALETLGALDVPLGPAPDERAAGPLAEVVARAGVDVLVLGAATSAGLVERMRVDPPPCLRLVVWCGIDPPPGLPAPVRRWLSVPEVAVFAAVDCPLGRLHGAPEARFEIVGGNLVLGARDGDSPLLRFDAEIAAALADDPCACGVPGATLRVEGAVSRI